MHWFRSLLKSAAIKPPAYMVERISDLRHAADISKSAPREAQRLIQRVMAQLDRQNDHDFAEKLKEAEKRVLDNPLAANLVIQDIITAMKIAKREDEKPCRTKSK